ncbi:MAG: hypothetical protein VR72_00980 [Clostridiaceae bacterium BRH_c20a]|nr:MAG: hypothetical protein VR72_00980 [Clostridiaceae bacterium BRH_c20a]
MNKLDGIGDLFKTNRVNRGLTLTDVENSTKIRSKYIKAIEQENFDLIPGKVYVKGFIKSYAKFLEIENNEEIKNFLEENIVKTLDIEKTGAFQVNNRSSLKGLQKKYITVVLSLIAVLILFGVQNIYDKHFKVEISPPPAPKDNGIPIEKPPLEEPPIEEDITTQLPEKIVLTMEILDLGPAKEACWIQVYSDNTLNFEGTMYQGDIKIFEADAKMKIILGNAGVVKLLLGEKDIGIPGKVGQVIDKEFTLDDLNS